MRRPVWRLLLGAALVVAGAGLVYLTLRTDKTHVKIGNATVFVDVADDNKEITQGLSGRDSLPSNRGMLFILEQPGTPSFWMKDMKFGIDIVWIGQDQKIVAVTPSLPPESYPRTFSPPSPVKYVLEVNSGFSASRGWLAGDTVELSL